MNGYLLKFDEINRMDLRSKSRDEIEDEFIQLLAEGYYLALEDLEMELRRRIELDELEDILWEEIAGETFVDRIDKHLANEDYGMLENLAESEFGRVYNTAKFRGAEKNGAQFKTWHTQLDWRVRETHWGLEGKKLGIDEKFVSVSGDTALYPKGFETVEENANCRCYLTFS